MRSWSRGRRGAGRPGWSGRCSGRRRGPLVLRAQCVDLGDPGLPYLAMADLLRRHRAATTPCASGRRAPTVGALAARSTRAAAPRWRGRPARGPVVVVLEDLQWVDSSSADFVRFLLSRMTANRLLVVATVRTDGLAARPRIRQLLSELGRLPSVRRLDLEPFDAAEVAEYLARVTGGDADADAAADVFRRTGGNPYYVETLARDVAAGQEAGSRAPSRTCWSAGSTRSRTTRGPSCAVLRSPRTPCPTGCCGRSPAWATPTRRAP